MKNIFLKSTIISLLALVFSAPAFALPKLQLKGQVRLDLAYSDRLIPEQDPLSVTPTNLILNNARPLHHDEILFNARSSIFQILLTDEFCKVKLSLDMWWSFFNNEGNFIDLGNTARSPVWTFKAKFPNGFWFFMGKNYQLIASTLIFPGLAVNSITVGYSQVLPNKKGTINYIVSEELNGVGPFFNAYNFPISRQNQSAGNFGFGEGSLLPLFTAKIQWADYAPLHLEAAAIYGKEWYIFADGFRKSQPGWGCQATARSIYKSFTFFIRAHYIKGLARICYYVYPAGFAVDTTIPFLLPNQTPVSPPTQASPHTGRFRFNNGIGGFIGGRYAVNKKTTLYAFALWDRCTNLRTVKNASDRQPNSLKDGILNDPNLFIRVGWNVGGGGIYDFHPNWKIILDYRHFVITDAGGLRGSRNYYQLSSLYSF